MAGLSTRRSALVIFASIALLSASASAQDARGAEPGEPPAAEEADATEEEEAGDATDTEDAAGVPAPSPAAMEAPIPEPPTSDGTTLRPPSPASAPNLAPGEDVARLDAWLSRFSNQSAVLRYVVGPLGIAVGGLAIGMGIWFMVENDILRDAREAAVGLGVALAALGVTNITLGIYNLIVPTYPESLHARFTAESESGLTDRAFGRFEGELRGMAEQSRTARYVAMAMGFALAVGGGVGLGVTAGADLDDSPRIVGLTVSGALAGTGLVLGLLSLMPSPFERAWEAYDAGKHPDDAALDLQLAPWGTADGGGFALTGRF